MENNIFEFAEDGQQAKSVQEEASPRRKKQVCTRRSKFVQEEMNYVELIGVIRSLIC